MQYLNARRTLGKLLEWGVVPVINENDTTATDEISFGDNDILAAQVAILLPADLLVVLSDVDALYTSDPSQRPGRRSRCAEVRDLAELRQLRDRHVELAPRLGRDAQQGAGGRDGDVGGHPGRDLQRHASRDADARRRGRAGRARASIRRRGAQSSFKLWLKYAKAAQRHGARRRGRRARAARAGHQPAAGRRGRGRGRLRGRRRRRRRRRPADGRRTVGKGISNYSAAELRRVKGLKSAAGARGAAPRERGGRAPRLLRAGLRRVAAAAATLSTMATRHRDRSPRSARGEGAPRTSWRRSTPRPRTRRSRRSPPSSRRASTRSSRPTPATSRTAAPPGSTPRCSTGSRSTRSASRRWPTACATSSRCPTRSARSSSRARSTTASSCARCACRSASSRSSTRRART